MAPTSTTTTESTERVLSDDTPLSESPVQTPALVHEMPGALPVTPAPSSQHTFTPTLLAQEASTPTPPSTHASTYPSTLAPKYSLSRGGTPKSSLSFRSRDKPSPGTPPTRPRGMTFPNGARVQKSTSQRTLDASASFETGKRPRLHTPGSSMESVGRDREGEEEEEDGADADSVMSFTPSMSGKIVASWFSGLLGRTAS
jgi:hypothetical protein